MIFTLLLLTSTFAGVSSKVAPDAELKKFGEKIGDMLLKQGSMENEGALETGFQLGKYLKFDKVSKICGELNLNEAGFLEYLAHDRKIFKKVTNEKPVVDFEKDVIDIQFNLTNKMNYIETKTFKLVVKKNNETGYLIKSIRMDGACSDANRINKEKIYTLEKKPEKMSAQYFMNYVVERVIPFKEVRSLAGRFSEKFVAYIEANPDPKNTYNKTEFLTYMTIFNDRYKHLKNEKKSSDGSEAQKIVILEREDTIIFRVSNVFKFRYNDTTDLFEFKIQALYNKDEDKRWKIAKIIMRPLTKIVDDKSIFRPIQVLMEKLDIELSRMTDETTVPLKFNSELTQKLRKVDYCGQIYPSAPGNFTIFLNNYTDPTYDDRKFKLVSGSNYASEVRLGHWHHHKFTKLYAVYEPKYEVYHPVEIITTIQPIENQFNYNL